MDRKSVLIVEDIQISADTVRLMLQKLGYHPVGCAAAADEAVEMACRLRPAAVLMDVRLKGGISGIEAARRIRSETSIPVIYMTGYTELAEVMHGGHEFIEKPVRMERLREVLEKVAGGAEGCSQ